ncbi:MAG: hypothetical protein ACJ76Y_05820 [Thermoanaerobaculia bacterium]
MGELTDKIPEVIPTFYYDLICRIVPGGIMLGTLIALRLPGSALFFQFKVSEASTILIGLGLSYVLGLLVTPFGALVGFLVWYFLSFKRLKLLHTKDLWKAADSLQSQKKPEAAEILSKMAAEMTLVENLFAGALGLLLLALLRDRNHVGSLVLLSSLCALSTLFRKAVLGHRVANLVNLEESEITTSGFQKLIAKVRAWRPRSGRAAIKETTDAPNPTAPADQKAPLPGR